MKNILILCLIFILVGGYSCKVSPEDPWLSFKSRENRVTNDWTLENLQKDGKDTTTNIRNIELEMKEDHEYVWVTTEKNGITTEQEGEWKIDYSDNRIITFKPKTTYDPLTIYDPITFYLYRVSSKELWLRQLDPHNCDGPNEYYFVSEN